MHMCLNLFSINESMREQNNTHLFLEIFILVGDCIFICLQKFFWVSCLQLQNKLVDADQRIRLISEISYHLPLNNK